MAQLQHAETKLQKEAGVVLFVDPDIILSLISIGVSLEESLWLKYGNLKTN